MAIANELNINTAATAMDMANAIFGNGIQVVSATYSGDAASSGTYSGALSTIAGVVPTDTGVILSTGNVGNFTNSSGTTDTNTAGGTGADMAGGIDGDAQLNAVSGQATFDGAILTADFIPTGDMLTMQFVFSSEEYPEFVNGGVNDSFGVWINGQFVEATISVAGNVSIDSVNGGSNQNLYRDNTADQFNTEMDGFTYVLSFKAPVTAGQVNTIKIGIADGGDAVYDSNLLVMGDSIQTYALAMDDTIQLTANSSRTFDILANDRDLADSGLTITHLNGTAVLAGQTVTLSTGEQVRLNADGTVTVFSDGDLGTNTLNYTIVDGSGNTDVGFIFIETVATTGPDGIVQGTAGADVIQSGYLGDPDGDRIDNNDGQGVGGTVGDDDYIMAGAGNDSIVAAAGNDIIYGGTGDDTALGGAGDDWASLGDGNDSFGTWGADSTGNDTVYGDAGNDVALGGHGQDVLFGGAGNDTLSGGVGADTFFGGTGNDLLYVNDDHEGDTLYGGENAGDNDRLLFGNYLTSAGVTVTFTGDEAGTYAFTATPSGFGQAQGSFAEFETVQTTAYNDTVDGSAATSAMFVETMGGNDSLTGGAGADSLYAGDGADTVYGGAGHDLIDLGAGDDSMGSWGANDAGNDTISGGSGNDTLNAGSGNDVVSGGDDNDMVYGSSGDDTLSGDAGHDRLYGGTGNDVSYGGAGNDTLQVVDSDQGETLFGGADTDHVQFSSYSSAAGVNVTFTGAGAGNFAYVATPGAGSFSEIESFGLTEYNDTFNATASTSAVTIGAGGGNDVIRGGSAADSLSGDADADTIYGGAGDTVRGGETTTTGTDNDILVLNWADVQQISYSVGNNEAGTVTFYGGGTLTFSEIEHVTFAGPVDGTSAGEAMGAGYTDLNGDQVDGSDGLNDTILGNGGDDTINAGSGNDLVYGGTGNDVLRAQSGNDQIFGDAGNDDLQSGSGNDLLNGGDGSDLIHVFENSGADTVVGGESGESGSGDILNLDQNLTADAAATVTFTGNEAGTASLGSATVSFSEIETVWTDGGNDTINAAATTAGVNLWTGGGGDFVTGGSGNDYVWAQSGNDEVFAGAGNDTVQADTGLDNVYGGDGADQLYGGADNDYMQGDAGNDLVDGGTGDDFLRGDAGNDLVFGGIGADSVYGGADSDTVYGDDGNDQVFGGFGTDTVYGGAGDDTVTGSGGSDVVHGDDGNDFLQGSDGDDTLYGGTGADTMLGEEDADSFHAGSGDYVDGYETVTTGTDNDTLYVTGIDHIVWDVLNPENGTVHYGDGSTVQFYNIERVFVDGTQVFPPDFIVEGGAGDDLIDAGYTGDPEGDRIDAADNLAANNDDVVQAGGGNDTVLAGDGQDSVEGEAGNDSLDGGAGNDSLTGGAGNDTLLGGAGNDSLTGWTGQDLIYGGDGNDTINTWGGSGDTGADTVYAGAGDDGVYGGPGDDLVYLEDGDDRFGTYGTDSEGNDSVYGGLGNDEVIGGLGNDTLAGDAGNDTFGGGLGNDLISGGDNDDLVYGEEGVDTLYGDAGNDYVDGGLGDDQLYAGAGNDTAYGGLGNDTLTGDAGADWLDGGAGDDSVQGGAGNDTLTNGDGSDTLQGGDDADLFNVAVNAGNSLVTGGEGGNDNDTLNLASSTNAVNLVFTADEAGTADHGPATSETLTFAEIERFVLTSQDDVVDASADGSGITVDAGAGNDFVTGGSGADAISGGAGDDQVVVLDGFGADTITGGETGETDGDVLDASGLTTDAVLNLAANESGPVNEDGALTAGGQTLTFHEIEAVILGIGNDSVIGSAGNDVVTTEAGRDTVVGGAGDDTFHLGADGEADLVRFGDGAGSDTLTGFEAPIDNGDGSFTGQDLLDVSGLTDAGGAPVNTADVTVSDDGAGNAVLTFPNGETITLIGVPVSAVQTADQLAAMGIPHAPNLVVDGTAGNDVMGVGFTDIHGDQIDGTDGDDDTIFGYDGNDSITAGVGHDTVYGGTGNDTIWGDDPTGSGNDVLYGDEGDDTLTGGLGNDTLYGGADNDTLSGSDGDDSLLGGAGNDSARGGTGHDGLDGNLGDDTLDGGSGNDTITGGAGHDVILAGSGNDVLSGGDGNDTITSSVGNDVVDAGANDDLVTGDSGDDSLNGETGNDTLHGGLGNDSLTGGAGNDSLFGWEDNDTVLGGAGDDMVDGDAGNDSLSGGEGQDTLVGDEGADTLESGAGNDQLYGGLDNDLLTGGEGDDLVFGGDGDDTLIGDGAGMDSLPTSGSFSFGLFAINSGGMPISNWVAYVNGTSTFNGAADVTTVTVSDDESAFEDYNGGGNSPVDGGAAQVLTAPVTITKIVGYDSGNNPIYGPVTFPAGTPIFAIAQSDITNLTTGEAGNAWLIQIGYDNTNIFYGYDIAVRDGDQLNWVSDNGGAQSPIFADVTGLDYSDLVTANGQPASYDDQLSGGAGNDLISGNLGDDYLSGEDGDDTLYGGSGNDGLNGDAGNDLIYGGAGNDAFDGGDGNDTLYGGDDNDDVRGSAGDDLLSGDAGNDIVRGGTGNDTLTGGDGADTLQGGDDRDSLFGGIGDVVDGGEGGDDHDVLDLTAWGHPATNIIYDVNNPENGTVEFLDAFGAVVGTMSFSNIETVVACFTPGSMILTDQGEVAVEDLAPGDRVLTRDNGYQVIRWTGRRDLSRAELAVEPRFNPVFIAKGALGQGLPERDMMVSPQHRMLISGQKAELLFGEYEVLVAAKHLVGMTGVEQRVTAGVSYVHILFDSHEIVRADGAWSESFQPGEQTLEGMDEDQRAEILALFPELAEDSHAFPSARLTLKAKEARVLMQA